MSGQIEALMSNELADRIRAVIGDDPNVGEIRMFGGLCFMLSNNMLVCTTRNGDLLVRTGGDRQQEMLARPGVARMVMGGRPMKDYVSVEASTLSDASLRDWIARATSFVGALPPKPAKDKKASRAGKKRS